MSPKDSGSVTHWLGISGAASLPDAMTPISPLVNLRKPPQPYGADYQMPKRASRSS